MTIRALSQWCSRQDHDNCSPRSTAGRLCECQCHGLIRFTAHPTATQWAEKIGNMLGITIQPAGSEAETELVDYVICIRVDDPTGYADNIHTICAKCGIGVQHRPHAPAKPPKLCLRCAMQVFDEELQKNET